MVLWGRIQGIQKADERSKSEQLQNVLPKCGVPLRPHFWQHSVRLAGLGRGSKRQCDLVAYGFEMRWGSPPNSQCFVYFPHLLQSILLIFLFPSPCSIWNFLRNVKLMQLCTYRGYRAILLSSHWLLCLCCALLCSNTTPTGWRMKKRASNLGEGCDLQKREVSVGFCFLEVIFWDWPCSCHGWFKQRGHHSHFLWVNAWVCTENCTEKDFGTETQSGDQTWGRKHQAPLAGPLQTQTGVELYLRFGALFMTLSCFEHQMTHFRW